MPTKTEPQTATYTAGYVRLTRDESLQNGLSAPAQRRGIEEYGQRAKIGPVRIFEETKAVGGDIDFDKRLAGRLLWEAIKRGEIKNLVVRDIDRLTRDMGLGLELMDMCRARGVTIHTFTGPIQVKSASDRFAFHVRSAAAEFEKNQTGDRVRKAKQESIRQGRWQGPPAYGFTSQAWHRSQLIKSGSTKEDAEIKSATEYPQKARLYINPIEAEIVRLIYELALGGMGSRRIVNELNKRGHRTRTGAYWSTERLSRTLNNPAAAGYLTYDDDFEDSGNHTPKQHQPLHRGTHEPIITLEEWQRVQRQRQANTDIKRRRGDFIGKGRHYPFSGILKCACGAPMRGKSLGTRKKAGRYVCTRMFYHGRKAINGCDEKVTTINANVVHDALWPKLREMVIGPDVVDRVFAATQKLARSGRKSPIQDPTQAITKLDEQIAKWFKRHDATEDEVAQEAAWSRIQELTAQRKELERIKTEQKKLPANPATITREDIERYLVSMTSLMESEAGAESRAYVRSLVQHCGLSIQINGEAITLSLALKGPGLVSAGSVPVAVEAKAELVRDKIDKWLKDNEGKAKCELCGESIPVLRRHYWLGHPRRHQSCHSRELMRLRNHRTDGLLTGADLARMFKVGDSTIGRWKKSGKLPKACKHERGTDLWHPQQVVELRGKRVATVVIPHSDSSKGLASYASGSKSAGRPIDGSM